MSDTLLLRLTGQADLLGSAPLGDYTAAAAVRVRPVLRLGGLAPSAAVFRLAVRRYDGDDALQGELPLSVYKPDETATVLLVELDALHLDAGDRAEVHAVSSNAGDGEVDYVLDFQDAGGAAPASLRVELSELRVR